MSYEGFLVAGRYRLTERIGSGAMGVVWQAQDERLGRIVAVKQLLLQPGLAPAERNEAIERAMREGRIAAKLHHPNAISVFDVVEEDGAPCLVMEYLPSRSLADVLAEREQMPHAEVAWIGSQVAAALAAAHAAGIVHRDIKPGNVLLGDNGTVKITDFGISRAKDDITVTKTGMIAGTPAYLAPEVARGKDPAPPSDVFSLGSMLYAAIEGEPPFGLSDNTLGVLHAVAAGRINPPHQSGPLVDVVVHMLAPQPEDRPSMARARQLLEAVAAGRTPTLPGMRPAPTAVDAQATSVVDGDRTRVVAGGPPSVPRTAAVSPPTVTSRAATQPPPATSRRPLIVAVIALVALIGVGALLLSNGWFDQRGGSSGDSPTNAGNTNVSSHTAESQPTSEASQTSQRDSSRQQTKTGGNTGKTETPSSSPSISQSSPSATPPSDTGSSSSGRVTPTSTKPSSSPTTPPTDNTSTADDPSKAGS